MHFIDYRCLEAFLIPTIAKESIESLDDNSIYSSIVIDTRDLLNEIIEDNKDMIFDKAHQNKIDYRLLIPQVTVRTNRLDNKRLIYIYVVNPNNGVRDSVKVKNKDLVKATWKIYGKIVNKVYSMIRKRYSRKHSEGIFQIKTTEDKNAICGIGLYEC